MIRQPIRKKSTGITMKTCASCLFLLDCKVCFNDFSKNLDLTDCACPAWEVLEWWKWGWSNGWIYLKNYFLTRKYSKMYRRLALEQISILLISYFCFLWKENDICNFLIFYFFSFWPTELRILLSYTGSMLYNVYNI